MNQEKLPAPDLITKPEELRELADLLGREAVVAVDTESNSLYAYQEQVCLLQFSKQGRDYLVDPLALGDLSPLAPLFGNPQIEKVFHAAEYDVLCLRRDFGFQFANLFDTMVAARVLGRDAVGLGNMLENEFGVHVNKRYQRANWGQRPLPEHLLDYARLDTHYLIELRNRLRAELIKEGRWELAQEDFDRLCTLGLPKEGEGEPDGSGQAQENDKNADPWRVSGSYDLAPQQAAVLLALCRYRDKRAKAINRPLFKVIGDRTLLAIASETPKNLDELSKLPGMSQKQMRRHGKQLLKAVQTGLEAKPLYPPRAPRHDNGYVERLEALRNWRKKRARAMGVMSDVVLPRDLLYTLAEANPEHQKDLADVFQDAPYRLSRFGEEILAVLER